MAIYYLSACRDCKERVMWTKVTKELAEKWHGSFHKEHNTVFGHDLNDDFYESIWEYKDLGIQEGELEEQPMSKAKTFSLRVHEKAELSIKESDDRLEFKLTNKDTGNSVEESYFRLDKGIDAQEAVKIDTIIYHMHNKIGLNLWK